ncbi:MAG TPA: sialidase family protein [Bryobacteraceae bacterium]|nr:sialidase family protein [Bryobacteraceae bacterium]
MTDTQPLTRKPGPRRESSAAVRNESALLVNPLDPNHIVGVQEITPTDGTRVISARVSFDGGAAWRESWPLPVERSWAGLVGPVLAVDAHGNLNLAALALDPDRSRASLVVYRSEDGGIHWTLPTVVLIGGAECCYSIAADLNAASAFQGSVYLAADMGGTLCFARSSDGLFWGGKGPARPGPMLPGLCFNPEVMVDARGTVHVVWMNGPGGDRIVSVASDDGGLTFGVPSTIAEGITVVQDGLPETAPATCIAPDGISLCVWADDREGRSRLYCRRSQDGGKTWQGPPAGQPLMPDGLSEQHEFQPHLIVTAGGEICCAFYEYGRKTPDGELLVDLAMAVSYDRGANFKSRMILSEQPWDPAVDKPLSRSATRGALGWLALG